MANETGNKKILIVGGGPGGYIAAIRAAQMGAEVTVIEKNKLGGTCLNIGCIPTKCLLHSAELLDEIRTCGDSIGVETAGLNLNFAKVMEHTRGVSGKFVRGIQGLFKANGIACINGTAHFVSDKKVAVEKEDGTIEVISPDSIIIAVGSVNAVPPIPGLKENENCIDSTGALNLGELPESMIVVGGGVIGLELGCAYAAFGTEVTVVEALSSMLPMLDDDITKVGVRHMKKMGIKFYLESPVQSVESCECGAKVICKDKNGEILELEAEKVLVAVGRRANTDSLDLDAAGIANDRGRILVSDRMETNVKDVYAIGDCVMGKAQLAHTASAMGEIAAENIMGEDKKYDEATNPTCVYMFPEAAAVGYTEQQAAAEHLNYKTGTFPMAANAKGVISNGGEGLVKIIADAETNRVIGMHMIGPRATDLIAEGALAIKMESTISDIAGTIHSHPTISETVREAALDADGRVLSMPPSSK
jgi:dihydrolipoamide dehydrogenase